MKSDPTRLYHIEINYFIWNLFHFIFLQTKHCFIQIKIFLNIVYSSKSF